MLRHLLLLISSSPICFMHYGQQEISTVYLTPDQNLSARVQSAAVPSRFYLPAGVYRQATIVPRSGDTFIGAKGTVLSGSIVLSQWTARGQFWLTSSNSVKPNNFVGKCENGYPRCNYPQDLFLDDTPLLQVGSISDLRSGTWYFDYAARLIYLSDSPVNHTVELSVTPYAFQGSAASVTIKNITVEKYANPAQSGAINEAVLGGAFATGWIVSNCKIHLNHGAGIALGKQAQLLNSIVSYNGQIGVAKGDGTGTVVEGNEIAFNNTMHYKYDWEAGGTKFHGTTNLIVRRNFVHDNRGPGLWTDGDNKDTVYENNHTARNKGAGILHEISFDARILNNLSEENGFPLTGETKSMWYGGGILVVNSSNVEIAGNFVRGCMNGIGGLLSDRGSSTSYGASYLLKNLNVHDNLVIQSSGSAAGILEATSKDLVFKSWGNRFSLNRYQQTGATLEFEWMNKPIDWRTWQLYRNDSGGSLKIREPMRPSVRR